MERVNVKMHKAKHKPSFEASLTDIDMPSVQHLILKGSLPDD